MDNLKKEEEEEVCCEDIEEDGEDDGILHISTDQSQPSYYRTLSFDEQNKNHVSSVIIQHILNSSTYIYATVPQESHFVPC